MVTNRINALVLLRSKFVTVKMNISDFRRLCAVCRLVDPSQGSKRETCWCSSMVETFLNTRTTRSSCSYEPAESRTPDSWPCLSDVKVSGRKVQQWQEMQICAFKKQHYYSLKLSLQRRFEPVGALAAATSCPHTDRPITGKQATVAQSVGAGRHVGGINETAGERDTVRHTLLPFWGISSTNRSQLLDVYV